VPLFGGLLFVDADNRRANGLALGGVVAITLACEIMRGVMVRSRIHGLRVSLPVFVVAMVATFVAMVSGVVPGACTCTAPRTVLSTPAKLFLCGELSLACHTPARRAHT
jgi:hypothetical protein